MPVETMRGSLAGRPGCLWGRTFTALLALLFVFCLAAAPGHAASKGNRYGAPLKFDAPPVELDDGAGNAQKPPAPSPAPASRGGSGEAAPGQAAQAKPSQAVSPTSINIFGTAAFGLNVKELPKWLRVRDSETKRPSFKASGFDVSNKQVAERWARTKEQLRDVSLMEKVKGVNKFFNQWPYKQDRDIWGVEDYWATPREFVQKSGDCEDYAIAKYYALRDLGVPASHLRIVAVKDTIRGIGHAVLVVFVDNDAYVLDNVSSMILSHKRLTNYVPQYSVNEERAWRQVKASRPAPAKKK